MSNDIHDDFPLLREVRDMVKTLRGNSHILASQREYVAGLVGMRQTDAQRRQAAGWRAEGVQR